MKFCGKKLWLHSYFKAYTLVSWERNEANSQMLTKYVNTEVFRASSKLYWFCTHVVFILTLSESSSCMSNLSTLSMLEFWAKIIIEGFFP